MSKITSHQCLHLCKKLHDWPVRDRMLWQAALVTGDLFEDGDGRAGFSDLSNRTVIAGYGRWLAWLEQTGSLDLESSPGDRITRSRVVAYVADLEKRNATQTILNRLQELRAAAQVLAPHQDSRWINKVASTIRVRHRPARPKRHRIVPLRVLFDLGLNLIQKSENTKVAGRGALVRQAILHRDGLLIALLAARQLRLANLAGLVIDRTLVGNGNQWCIQIPETQTKNGDPIERSWPERLKAPLEDYLTCHREILLRGRRSSQGVNGGCGCRFRVHD